MRPPEIRTANRCACGHTYVRMASEYSRRSFVDEIVYSSWMGIPFARVLCRAQVSYRVKSGTLCTLGEPPNCLSWDLEPAGSASLPRCRLPGPCTRALLSRTSRNQINRKHIDFCIIRSAFAFWNCSVCRPGGAFVCMLMI